MLAEEGEHECTNGTVPVRMMREWHGQEDSMRLFGVLSPVLATIVIHEGIALDDDGNQYTWNRWSLEHALSVATILGAARLSARDGRIVRME